MATGVKKRIGVHVGTAGGTWTAVERAVAAGANTFQIFLRARGSGGLRQ